MNSRIRAIRCALDFIEGHLGEDISVGDIANAAGYSLYHFIRTFNQVVQHSPYDFLMRRRLTEAARDLLATDHKILDIALDYCFHNHETFSRAFKRMFQTQPSQFRSDPLDLDRLYLPPLSNAYLAHINHKDFRFPEYTPNDRGSQVLFFHPGSDQTLKLTLSYIHHTWLPQSEVQLAYLPAAEDFLLQEEPGGWVISVPVI